MGDQTILVKSILIKETVEIWLVPCSREEKQEDAMKKWTLCKPTWCGALVMNFPSSRNLQNKVLLFIRNLPYGRSFYPSRWTKKSKQHYPALLPYSSLCFSTIIGRLSKQNKTKQNLSSLFKHGNKKKEIHWHDRSVFIMFS